MPMSHSGADARWMVATKKIRNKGIPVSTGNRFSVLDEEASDEEEVHTIEGIPEEETEPPLVQ